MDLKRGVKKVSSKNKNNCENSEKLKKLMIVIRICYLIWKLCLFNMILVKFRSGKKIFWNFLNNKLIKWTIWRLNEQFENGNTK